MKDTLLKTRTASIDFYLKDIPPPKLVLSKQKETELTERQRNLLSGLGKLFNKGLVKESESLKGVRGGVRDSGLNIHSIRLPGLLAHQVVIMGSPGETYTIKHDTIDRKAYMPGVLQAIRKIKNYNSLIYGLEKLIF